MILRKGISALVAATTFGLAVHGASAAVVSITVDGCKDGQNIHTTVSFNCNVGLLNLDGKGKKTTQLCGGIVFAAPCSNPDFNAPGNIVPPDDTCNTNNKDIDPDGPLPQCPLVTDHDGPDEHCLPKLDWTCHDPCETITGPTGIPTLETTTAATPLPSSAWGAGALLASLSIVHRLRRKTA